MVTFRKLARPALVLIPVILMAVLAYYVGAGPSVTSASTDGPTFGIQTLVTPTPPIATSTSVIGTPTFTRTPTATPTRTATGEPTLTPTPTATAVKTATVVRSQTIFSSPVGVAVNPSTNIVYVASNDPGSLVVVDGATLNI